MGRIGFLFEVENNNHSQNIVVFLEDDRVLRHVIIGSKSFLKEDDCKFYFLSDSFDLKKFLVFENSIFKYAKICVAKRRFVDFEYLTLWFKAQAYKILRETLLVEGFEDQAVLEDEIKRRTYKLFKFFEKYY